MFPLCLPGVSTLVLSGDYLYDLTMTVGGQACNRGDNPINPTLFISVTPVIAGDRLGTLYDVIVGNSAGRVVMPGPIGYTVAPSISAVVPCWSDGCSVVRDIQLARCSASDTILGSRLQSQAKQVLANITLTLYSLDT